MEYIHYLLAVIGIGYFITGSDLAQPFREWVTTVNQIQKKFKPVNWIWDKFDGVLDCIYCCSFWVGIGVCFLVQVDCKYVDILLNAFSVLGLIYIVKNIFPK